MTAREHNWHSLDMDTALALLNTGSGGLEMSEAARRLAEYGPNELESGEQVSRLKILLAQLTNPLVFVLMVAAAISLLAGKTTDAIVIGVVIIVNSLIGYVQEYQAEMALESR